MSSLKQTMAKSTISASSPQLSFTRQKSNHNIEQCEVRLGWDPLLMPKQEIDQTKLPSSMISLTATRKTAAEVFITAATSLSTDTASVEVDTNNILPHARAKYKCPNCSEKFCSYIKLTKHKMQEKLKQGNQDDDDDDDDGNYSEGDNYDDDDFELDTVDILTGVEQDRENVDKILQHKYTCSICYDTFIGELDYENHMKFHLELSQANDKHKNSAEPIAFDTNSPSCENTAAIPESSQSCSLPKEFGTQQSLDKHFEEHDDHYSCDICETGFKKLIDYTFHMRGHSDDKLYKCPLCQFVTDKDYLAKSHLHLVHEQFTKYKCEVCSKGFAIFTHFQEHKYFHTGEKPFQCDICGKKFMYTRYLNSHKVQMHKRAQKGFECNICKKMYSHRNSLHTHMKSHLGVVSVCDVCGKTFSSNEKLRLHFRTHTGEKPFKCDYCDKRFKTSSYRAEHQRIHTGEKPYECPFCGKGFSQRTSMIIHSRGHTGEKPYLCHLCNKGFAAKSMVTIHLKSCKGGIGHHIADDD